MKKLLILLLISINCYSQDRLPASGALAMSDILGKMIQLGQLDRNLWLTNPYKLKMLVDSSSLDSKTAPHKISYFYSYPPYFYNTYQDTTMVRDNCTGGLIGTTGRYWVPSGQYESSVSQDDANIQARDDIDTYAKGRINGGIYAGGAGYATAGSCITAPSPGYDNKIYLSNIDRLQRYPFAPWTIRMYFNSDLPTTSDLAVYCQINGINGGTTIYRTENLSSGKTGWVVTLGGEGFDYVNKGVNGSILSLTPTSDSNFNYTY